MYPTNLVFQPALTGHDPAGGEDGEGEGFADG
jgi:hypothetical protein